ncbi:hypothetical protein GOZ78_01675 [Agrobacterium vitis]|uniref:Uncharacterized protein n=1 Tax=Agrobacterium vitis TaxID=373 RepID=A0A7K1RD76_AGRVI|nr:hypothetical protein [Agrobacterium vitis]MUZ81082.1 hypothetical protein [Agrobacterium vitis]MVA08732.1 hypothetical protein [Agrobacterium vitis]MVA55946.1 hypothetical protein [Agrobacterium vitis]
MATGEQDVAASTNLFDPMASWARLSERVENQGKDIVDLRSNMNTGFQSVQSSINALSNELRSSSKTQWPVIWAAAGVCFGIIVALGSQALSPIKEAVSETKTDLRVTAQNSLSVAAFTDFKATYENNRVVSRNDLIDKFNQVNTQLETIRKDQVPRAELERTWQSEDQQRAQMQKQIDELKQGQATTYSARDLLLDMRDRQDRFERQLYGQRPPS